MPDAAGAAAVAGPGLPLPAEQVAGAELPLHAAQADHHRVQGACGGRCGRCGRCPGLRRCAYTTLPLLQTPSLESCQARLSALALAQAAGRETRPVREDCDRDASAAVEEGRVSADPAVDSEDKHTSPPTPIGMNYPVGKPLEVS